MEIRLRLHGALRRYRPREAQGTGAFPVEVDEGATVDVVIDRLGIPRSWVRGAYVNGEACKRERRLREGDELALFPPAGGGAC